MPREIITTDRIAPSVGPFSAAVRAGDLLFLSGQVALDPATGKLVAGDIAAQTEQIFANISAVLEAAGKSFDDVMMGDPAGCNDPTCHSDTRFRGLILSQIFLA